MKINSKKNLSDILEIDKIEIVKNEISHAHGLPNECYISDEYLNYERNKIFFGIKGNSFNGIDFADEAIKNGAKIAIVQNIGKSSKKKIKVKNTLKLLTEFSKKIRISSNACHVAITGSSGKTSLKELIGQSLNNCYSTVFSKYSYNNKFGVPISLTDLKLNTNFGVFEIGMDKKGEIDNLSRIISRAKWD